MNTTFGTQLMEMYGPGVTAKEWAAAGIERTTRTLYDMTHSGDGWEPLTRKQAREIAQKIVESARAELT